MDALIEIRLEILDYSFPSISHLLSPLPSMHCLPAGLATA